MNKIAPAVAKYMSTSPLTIGVDQTIATASKVMRENRIRHLPVLHGGTLVGILSSRDVALIETLRDVDPAVVTVEEAMTQMPYTVSPETGIDRVAAEMAEHKYGAVIIVENGRVVGVFTSVDACAALAEMAGVSVA